MAWYLVELGRCPGYLTHCDRPTTHAVHTSGTARYFTGCKRCATAYMKARERQAKPLEKAEALG